MAIRKPVIGIPEGGPHTALGEIPIGDTLDPASIPPEGGSFPGTGLEVPTHLAALDRMWSAGKLTGLDMTDAGGGLVDISAGEAIFRTSASRTAPLENLPVTGVVGQALTDNMVNWVYADYNAGTPLVLVTTNEAIINELDLITLGLVYRTGTAVAFANVDDEIVDAIDRIRQLFEDVNGAQRVVGSSLISDPTPSSLKVAVTSGSYYIGLSRINHPAFDTSVADTFTYWHRDGGGGWTATLVQTDIDNGFFDDGSGVLAALGANRFNNAWVYLQVADNISSIHVVYGRDNSPNFQGADGANVPGDIPPSLVDIGVFIGRWIIQQGVGIPAAIDSAFEQTFSTSAVADHNSLAGLQGGLPAERNHLNNADLAALLAHLTDTANPHSVTIGQIGAEAANANIQAHVAGPVTGNPHAVTFTEAVTADGGTDITAAEAETLTDGSNADALHVHAAGSGAFALAILQIRDTTAQTIGTAWADVTFNTTDHENEPATIEHNNANTDEIDLKIAGRYHVEYDVNFVLTGSANTNLLLQGRIRLNNAGTGIVGSHAEDTQFQDNSIEGVDVETQVHGGFYVNAAANDKLTLQLQYVDVAGTGTPGIDTDEVSIKVTQLFRT